MDAYFPKTRRPMAVQSIKEKTSKLKTVDRVAPKSQTHNTASIPCPKPQTQIATTLKSKEKPTAQIENPNPKTTLKRPISPGDHSNEESGSTNDTNNNNNVDNHDLQCTPPKAKLVALPKDKPRKKLLLEPPGAPKKKKPSAFRKLFDNLEPIPKFEPPKSSTDAAAKKIDVGPLKGISTSLLDLVRAKEAAMKNVNPELERKRELLGIAPDIARIVPTIFTASKKEIMSYDKVVDDCCKSLKMNYTSKTIDDCITFMVDSISPEWISVVKITRGKFMRLNKDKYTIPQLLEAIKRYKKDNGLNL